MSLPIYLSDPSGAGLRTASTHDFITKNMHDTVSNAVRAAGFTPVKHAAPDMVEHGASLEGYGGLILFGGYDIDSSYYKSGYSRKVSKVDAYELDLIFAAMNAGLPVFGICRGMQLINVAFGGTLHSDIGHLTKFKHNNFGAGSYEHQAVAHDVEVFNSSVLGDGMYRVASSHHQAVKDVGEGLTVTGYGADDEIIEMIEAPELNVIGTQWHPESMHVKQDDTLTPILADFLRKVPTQHTTVTDGLPAIRTAQGLRDRFPVKQQESMYRSYRSASGYVPMWLDGFDDLPGVSKTRREAWYLDEEDDGLLESAYAELGYQEDDELEQEIAKQRERDAWAY